ncbi:helix-turn-helix domain-containing protein [Methylobacterium sp. J-048]|uniref:helix-turn-helix domain-containing protein n=1 Tax=Methylobacterium sp. J-048 TaxID=2836635 RepID=UPI001FBA0D5B|nr:helix-turn-helix domain-containing protein [Methylobacterium sp. J-048]MCJ2059829.1 helix-turn-helix domain-containing protein [Methylobacterium sp. J-048]
MFADEIRRAIEAANRIALPQVTALLWRAYGEGKVTEAEAEALSGLIEARTDAPATPQLPQAVPSSSNPGDSSVTRDRAGSFGRAVGSRPRTDASLERRRRWAASGRLPPGLAARFTLAEQAVLALVAAEVARRKDCRLAIENLAALAGVGRTAVKNALREARRLGLVTVEERQVTGWRNDTNIVRIVSREWIAWLQLTRKRDPLSKFRLTALVASEGGGVANPTTTPTKVLESGKMRPADPSQGAFRRAEGRSVARAGRR